MEFRHVTVLREEVVMLLRPRQGAFLLDGTLGGGGHAEAILEKGGTVLGLDRDPHAILAARTRLQRFGKKFEAEQASFSEAKQILHRRGIAGIDGVVLDLGVSSSQLDEPGRGFSFSQEGPLDMRMSSFGQTAAELLADCSEKELEQILREYGEEPWARRIANAILRETPLPQTTTQLAAVVARTIPRKLWPQRIHPATRTFQALRIAVNRELDELDSFLSDLPTLLTPGGRAAIISFHSLEDRKVKQQMASLEGKCRCPPKLPICACGVKGDFRVITRKALVAGPAELSQNPRSRSARLRAVEKIQ